MKKLKIVIFIFSLVLFLTATTSAERLNITLEEVVSIAAEKNLDIKIERLQTNVRTAQIDIEEGAFDAALDIIISEDFKKYQTSTQLDGAEIATNRTKSASVSVGQKLKTGTQYALKWVFDEKNTNSLFVTDSPYYTSDFILEVKQPLLKGLGRQVQEANIEIARNNQSSSLLSLTAETQIVMTTVVKLYWDLLNAHDELNVAKLSLKLAKKLNDVSEARIEAGLLAPSEILQTEAEIAKREENLLNARKRIKDSEDLLKATMNYQKWETELFPVDKPQISGKLPVIETELEEAFALRIDYQQAIIERKSRTILVDVAKNKLLPDLSVIASAGPNVLTTDYGDTINKQLTSNFYSWKAGVELKMPLGNSTARAALRKARAEEKMAIEALTRIKQAILVEIRESVRAIELAREKINATIKTEELAKKRLENEDEKFKSGMSTAHDVLTFQEAFANALANKKKTTIDYAKAIADLWLVKRVGKNAL